VVELKFATILRSSSTQEPSPVKPIVPFDPSGDHRMAFAFALGALDTGGTILDPLCVNKTFPNFWMEWSKMSKQG